MSENEEGMQSSKVLRKRQYIRIAYGVIAMAIIVYGYDFAASLLNPASVPKKEQDPKILVELATESLDGGKIWFNNLDQRLKEAIEGRKSYEEEQKELLTTLEKKVSSQNNNSKIDLLEQQVSWLRKELEETDRKISEPLHGQLPPSDHMAETVSHKIPGSENNELGKQFKEADDYIPAGSFVSGILRGGISASTGVGTPSEPPPIFIRVTGPGDLPQNFKVDLTKCRIVGSGYGSMANERIIARAETLSCTNDKTGKVIETQIAGVVHGTDSKNGIKGEVVSMAGKHLKNAAIGGIISGFAGSSKSNEGFMFNPNVGAISTKKTAMADKITDSLGQGASSAAEKLADYHMKMAESAAPVVEVPGAVPVTVFFSKGVYMGSQIVKEEIKNERK